MASFESDISTSLAMNYILIAPDTMMSTTSLTHPVATVAAANNLAAVSGQKKTTSSPPLKPPKREREEHEQIQRCKRKLDFAKLGLHLNRANGAPTGRRNERERNRVKLINLTFNTLREHVPQRTGTKKGKGKKLSKVDTLKAAIDYIQDLQELIVNHDAMHSNYAVSNSQTCQVTPHYQPQESLTSMVDSPGSTYSATTSDNASEPPLSPADIAFIESIPTWFQFQ